MSRRPSLLRRMNRRGSLYAPFQAVGGNFAGLAHLCDADQRRDIAGIESLFGPGNRQGPARRRSRGVPDCVPEDCCAGRARQDGFLGKTRCHDGGRYARCSKVNKRRQPGIQSVLGSGNGQGSSRCRSCEVPQRLPEGCARADNCPRKASIDHQASRPRNRCGGAAGTRHRRRQGRQAGDHARHPVAGAARCRPTHPYLRATMAGGQGCGPHPRRADLAEILVSLQRKDEGRLKTSSAFQRGRTRR